MNSKNIILGAVILVILAGGYFLMKGQSSKVANSNPLQVNQENINIPANTEPTKEVQKPEGMTVEYSENGFSPQMVLVKAGSTVTFVNKGSDLMWVASSPHPQHTDLAGFDALKGYKTGESYTYTFTQIGTWKFHNHLNPKDFGSVVVEP
ncbi:MAG: Plastocyanin [Candidatus Gottesmanbacteria bacterium GW2011_GWC2_39_8]|uniref:Plastocyanin n=1 Tax=Candidatus Gottesmanbacteria bacterium GW2011_GWC2_39_8 TaxID=1618450 RepID=A0A0G0Q0Q2_9BACT|nr:MAG: Plastocyanin [Candidatus Gottesmanbacteria bacterium GW2011_GWC2_39_8]